MRFAERFFFLLVDFSKARVRIITTVAYRHNNIIFIISPGTKKTRRTVQSIVAADKTEQTTRDQPS